MIRRPGIRGREEAAVQEEAPPLLIWPESIIRPSLGSPSIPVRGCSPLPWGDWGKECQKSPFGVLLECRKTLKGLPREASRVNSDFFNLYSHDFIRVAACVPAVRTADPSHNAERTVELLREASDRRAVLAVFPELESPPTPAGISSSRTPCCGPLSRTRNDPRRFGLLDMVIAAGVPLR